jgi:uncharacterized protein (DUF169 family)
VEVEMSAQTILEKYATEFEKYIRPRCFPLAIKLLENDKDIPKDAIRPKRDLNVQWSLCQAYGMSRRAGEIIAMLKEDMWCPEPIICYGLVEPPSYFLEGRMNFLEEEKARYVKNLAAARNLANSQPRFEPGRYIGIVSSPTEKAKFDADLMMVYCTPAQVTLLMAAAGYSTGNGITSTMGGGACVRSVIPPMQTKQYQIAVPCPGDRRWGLAQDDELIFTIPAEKMEEIMEGLRAMAGRYPVTFVMKPNHELPSMYMRTREILGLG